ncbi:MAG: translation initiation factor IF-5A [archaeon]|nr:translation initiation factor IF-5A [archaeon]MCR4324015.1 translation initiation factor IF-5A [Nanoarchaeota archaeon]
MVSKVIDATEMRAGTYLIIEGSVYQVKKMDISKTGKHGHAKVRFEASSAMTGKKKVMVVPGHDKFEVPMVTKRQGQVLSIHGENANIMDSESFENLDLPIPEELIGTLVGGVTVEYWDLEGEKIIKKIM